MFALKLNDHNLKIQQAQICIQTYLLMMMINIQQAQICIFKLLLPELPTIERHTTVLQFSSRETI